MINRIINIRTPDDEPVEVFVSIDELALAKRLGRKAIKSKGGLATLLNGIIKVKAPKL